MSTTSPRTMNNFTRDVTHLRHDVQQHNLSDVSALATHVRARDHVQAALLVQFLNNNWPIIALLLFARTSMSLHRPHNLDICSNSKNCIVLLLLLFEFHKQVVTVSLGIKSLVAANWWTIGYLPARMTQDSGEKDGRQKWSLDRLDLASETITSSRQTALRRSYSDRMSPRMSATKSLMSLSNIWPVIN